MGWVYSLPARGEEYTMMVKTALLAVLVVELFAPSPDKEEAYKIETESDKAGGCCKSRYLLNVGHYLGDSVKNP
jgi:hypothetical protein